MNDTSESSPLFIAVGHCGPDAWMLRTAIQRLFPDATLEDVADDDALAAGMASATDRPAVLLVNRKLDGDFAAGDGIELIEAIGGGTHAAILVTDLPDAAAAAIEVGAVPGFGKSDLHGDATAEALRHAVEVAGGPAGA